MQTADAGIATEHSRAGWVLAMVIGTTTLTGLLALSEGRTLAPDETERLVTRAPGFVERARLAWVVVHPSQTPPAPEAFAIRAFDLERVAADGDAVLYRTRGDPAAGATPPARPSSR